VFHLEKYTRGGKRILRENLGGPRDCARQHVLWDGGGGGVWGHSPPRKKILNFRPPEIPSGEFSDLLGFQIKCRDDHISSSDNTLNTYKPSFDNALRGNYGMVFSKDM